MKDKTYLVQYANLAEKILNENSNHLEGKKLISSLFEENSQCLTLEKIKLRLTIIDAMYSTQMSRRLFGINDLALKIWSISEKKDSILKSKIELFLVNTNNELNEIFKCKFGIDKKGEEKGKAISLISKYFYFLTNYKFPIYDSLVKYSLPIINKKFKIVKKLNLNNENEYFKNIIDFNNKSKIQDFNKLDNLCWLYGKVSKGSFSIIVNKEKYINLVIDTKLDKTTKDNKKIDNTIRDNLRKNIPSNIFSKDEEDFITWVLTLKNSDTTKRRKKSVSPTGIWVEQKKVVS